jgi:hypothetical protein
VKTLASHNGNIKALFLPPNTTALFQRMDQGVIESLKIEKISQSTPAKATVRG